MPDYSDLKFLRQIFRTLHFAPQKSFGQNFLVNAEILEKIEKAADLQKTDTVLEIGPGPGGLTQRLLPKAQKVVVLEIDTAMIALLHSHFPKTPNLEILAQDALNYQPNFTDYKIVANLPYYITSPLLRHYLMEVENKPQQLILLVQEEVAQKIVDHKAQSVLSLQVKIFGTPEYLFKVPKENFYPAPKVDSAVIKIGIFTKPLIPADELQTVLKTIKIGFSQKRKKIINAFLALPQMPRVKLEEIFKKAEIDPARRAQTLTILEWQRLSAILWGNCHSCDLSAVVEGRNLSEWELKH